MLFVQCDESNVNAALKFKVMGAAPDLPIHWKWGFGPSELPELRRTIEKHNIKFVGIDSVTTVVGGHGIKSSDPEFALFLYKLNHLAAELGISIVILIHLRKPETAKRIDVTLNDFMGTGALTAACSDVFGYWKNQREDAFPDQFILRCLGKRNVDAGVTYDLQGCRDDFSLTFAGVQGGGPTPRQRRSTINRAIDWLRERRGEQFMAEDIAAGISANERVVANALRDFWTGENRIGLQRITIPQAHQVVVRDSLGPFRYRNPSIGGAAT